VTAKTSNTQADKKKS